MNDSQQTPSLREMVYSLSETAKEVLKNAVERNIILIPEEQALARLDICLECEFFITKPENSIIPARCGKCGCGMKVKTRLAASRCPINKWGPL